MKIPLLKKANVNYKKYYVENLNSVGGIAINFVQGKSGKISPITLNEYFPNVLSIGYKQLYCVNGVVYAFANDNRMYRFDQTGLRLVSNTEYYGCPSVVSVLENGQSKTLIVCENGNAESVGEDGVVKKYTLPLGNVCAVYNGMLFIANGNTVNFSTKYDFSDFTTSIDRAGVFNTQVQDGAIVALIVQNNKLVIFAEHAVYEFTAFGERIDYALKKIETIVPEIVFGTVKDCGKKIVFLSGKDVCAYENQKISVLLSLPNGYEYAGNIASVDKSIYCLPVMFYNEKIYSLCVDVESKNRFLIELPSSVIGDCGYSVNASNNICKIVNGDGNWIFKCRELNFYTAKEKTINEITVFCDSKCSLTLKGDYGEKSFSLKKGANCIKINFSSRSFYMEFSGQTANAIIDLRIKYRVKGE